MVDLQSFRNTPVLSRGHGGGHVCIYIYIYILYSCIIHTYPKRQLKLDRRVGERVGKRGLPPLSPHSSASLSSCHQIVIDICLCLYIAVTKPDVHKESL